VALGSKAPGSFASCGGCAKSAGAARIKTAIRFRIGLAFVLPELYTGMPGTQLEMLQFSTVSCRHILAYLHEIVGPAVSNLERKLRMRRAIACVGLTAFMSLGTSGQTPTASSVFEVASVRLNKTGIPRRGSIEFSENGKRFTATNLPLGPLLLTAYDTTARQISVPASFPGDRYDIEATVEHAVSPDEMRRMLQELLIDRFKLHAHRETREVAVYALVIAKGRPKLHPSEKRDSNASPRIPSRAGGTEPQIGHLVFNNESMSDFAWALSRTTGIGDRIVVDQTGLTGNYDFELTFGRDNAATSEPSVFSALQEQLGLRLEPNKAAVEFLVIDHVEKPSDN
jgi:uncharacterized protein (TIGR03435 family)